MTKAAESLTAQLDSQGKLTTPRQKNIKKSRHEIEILKASEHATHVCKLQIYIEWHQKNIPQNLMSLYPFKFVLTPPQYGAHSAIYCIGTIDISWLDWASKSSTCHVMYRRPRRHLYYGGEI
jgi:hypothetical protein